MTSFNDVIPKDAKYTVIGSMQKEIQIDNKSYTDNDKKPNIITICKDEISYFTMMTAHQMVTTQSSVTP